jgi:hypothetical protein
MKILKTLMLVLAASTFGMGVAQADIPTIDGALTSPTEWDNDSDPGVGVTPYPFYRFESDPDEADNQIQNMDISGGTLLQELTSFSGDGDFSNDGFYIMLTVYAPPPSLAFATGVGITVNSQPVITLQGDLLGDGFGDAFNVFIRHYNAFPATGLPAADVVDVCVGSLATCNSIGAVYVPLTALGGAFSRGTILEYFIKAGTLGTPPSPPGTPFPAVFIGSLTYDNGASGPATSDDVVLSLPRGVIPEPGTMFLVGTGILSLLGSRRFGRN